MILAEMSSSFAAMGTILISLFVVFYLFMKYKHTYWARRGIYSPPAHWFFGHFLDTILMRNSPPGILGDLHKSSEGHPVVGFYVMHKPFLLVRNAAIAKRIFIKDFHIFPNRYFGSDRNTDPVSTQNLFSINNPKWKYLRNKLTGVFTTSKLKRVCELMLENADNMEKFLTKKVPPGAVVSLDMRNVSTRYTTDVISSLSFGIKTDSFLPTGFEFYKRSRSLFNLDFYNIMTLFLNFFFPKLNDIFGFKFLNKNEQYFRNLFWESINERERSGIKRGDLIDSLLSIKLENETAEYKFEGDHLLAQSAIFFVAGTETSAITMSFALWELAKQPEIQKKVREEIRNKIGDEKITYEKVSQMNYLQQIVSETLRIYPPAPILDRVANDNYKIPETDIVIEKGTIVYVVLNGMHTDPNYHPDPDTFDPDRFSESRKNDIESCSYMPFGDGPRICIGSRIGMLQTMIGLITILREYEIFDNPEFKNEISPRSIFIIPTDGIRMNLKKKSIMTD